jgi:hypothetical protein
MLEVNLVERHIQRLQAVLSVVKVLSVALVGYGVRTRPTILPGVRIKIQPIKTAISSLNEPLQIGA